MRVLQLNKRYWPHRGGVERHVRDLAAGLAARPGVSVSALVCNEGPTHRHSIEDGVAIDHIPGYGTVWSLPVSPSYPLALQRQLRQKPDIVHLHEPFPLGGLAWLLAYASRSRAAAFGPRLIITWHSDVVRQRLVLPIYGALLRTLLTRADAVIVPTDRHVATSRFLPRVASKCHVIPFGIDVAPFMSAPAATSGAALRRDLGGERLVLFLGRLVAYKGLPHLVSAMQRVMGTLVLAGDGRDRRALEELARTIGVTEKVRFVGDISEAELPAFYHACDVFVLPSVHPSEGFGIVQLEAMASARPVVSTSLPTGVSTVNRHGETGLIVPPGDEHALAAALQALLDDPPHARALGERGRERVLARYNLNQMVGQTLALYESTLPTRTA